MQLFLIGAIDQVFLNSMKPAGSIKALKVGIGVTHEVVLNKPCWWHGVRISKPSTRSAVVPAIGEKMSQLMR